MSFVCVPERVTALGGQNGSHHQQAMEEDHPSTVYNGGAKSVDLGTKSGVPNLFRHSSRKYFLGFGLRLLTFVAIMAAFVIMLTAKQVISLDTNMIHFRVVAKWTDDRTSMFYVYSLGIIAPYVLVTTLIVGYIAYCNCIPKSRILWTITVMDLMMAFLLMSSIAASASIGLVAQKGAPKENWMAVCGETRHYCNVAGVAFIISGLGFVGLFQIVLLDIFIFYRIAVKRAAEY